MKYINWVAIQPIWHSLNWYKRMGKNTHKIAQFLCLEKYKVVWSYKTFKAVFFLIFDSLYFRNEKHPRKKYFDHFDMSSLFGYFCHTILIYSPCRRAATDGLRSLSYHTDGPAIWEADSRSHMQMMEDERHEIYTNKSDGIIICYTARLLSLNR